MSFLFRCAALAAMNLAVAQGVFAETDPHSHAQPNTVRVTSLALDLSVSFDKRELAGSVTLDLDWHDKAARELVLDTNDLAIEKVEVADKAGHWSPAKFSLDKADPALGSALRIAASPQNPEVRITYTTSPNAFGLQWLDPAQTAGNKHPFMFSQSESIAARSWVPLQDTPAVRFTYTAHIRVPKELRAVMSADNNPRHALDGDFRFTMPQKIPSYLLALAVGDLAVKETGPRTAVYAEPQTVALAAGEFSDTEKMIETAEKLYGPYRWGRYDILVLPPSFPFGGMENPRLTFATPTVLVGDKSLVSLVAHELAHSWSGNLVTMAGWRHIWLNEGFTTYVQGRIVEAVYGKQQADEEFIIDANELREELKGEIKAEDQRLVPELKDRSPDDGLSDIAYTKGSWFLQWLEAKFGRATFDPFLRGYFDHFAFQSITTDQFVDYLKANLLAKHPGVVTMDQVNAWLHEAGIPADAPMPTSARFAAQDKQREAFVAGKLDAADLHAQKWTTQEWEYFLDKLPEKLPLAQMQALDAAYRLTGMHNAVIGVRWYKLAVGSDYAAAYPAMREHMLRIGRMILVVPLYEALAKTPAGRALAEKIYAQAKPGYHPMTRHAVEKALTKKSDTTGNL
ncbi:MAG TPA: M1 family metallopeptidase [Rudaea sp.]|nr:M1 family metallopeptidase [Rudaea sp.]